MAILVHSTPDLAILVHSAPDLAHLVRSKARDIVTAVDAWARTCPKDAAETARREQIARQLAEALGARR